MRRSSPVLCEPKSLTIRKCLILGSRRNCAFAEDKFKISARRLHVDDVPSYISTKKTLANYR